MPQRPAALEWSLWVLGLLVAAASLAVALRVGPGLAWRAGGLAVVAGLVAAAAVWRWPQGGLGSEATTRTHLVVLGVAVAVAFAVRLAASMASAVPLGYDYGFYRAAFEAYAGDLPLRSQPTWMALQFEPGLPTLQSVLAGVAGLSADQHLRILHPALAALNGLVAFAAVRSWAGPRAGLVAAGLMAFSALQLEAHAYLYGKNLAALGLLLAALLLLHRRHWWACGLVLGGLGAWHRPTFLLAGLAFALVVLADAGLRRSWKGWALTGALAVAVAAPVWLAMPETFLQVGRGVAEGAAKAIAAPETRQESGTFPAWPAALRFMAAYLPLAVAGVAAAWRWPALRPAVALGLVAAAYVALQLPLNRRFLLMADEAAILVAASALVPLAGAGARRLGVAVVGLVVVLGVAVVADPPTPHRFLTEPQWEALQSVDGLPDDAVLLADNLRAPYVLAALGHRTYGPGLFDDPHDRGDWQRFWSGLQGEDLHAFLEPYGGPLYVVQVDQPGPDWGAASLRPPEFSLVSETGGLRLWQYTGAST
jgi:hypothetical protein